MKLIHFKETMPGGSHNSMVIRAGQVLSLTDIEGAANLSMMFYNPNDLLERYNAPDTLKCQQTFKLTQGNCLYSDMGRIFCSIIRDDSNWIDTVAGVADKQKVQDKWGARIYQQDRNNWLQNGADSLLVEVAKYGLTKRDLAMNLNLFSKVQTDEQGQMSFASGHSKAGTMIELRFEMDTLVVMSSCPHPMDNAKEYPNHPIEVVLRKADPISDDDQCLNSCPENGRGFENNRRYLCQYCA